MFDDSTRRRFVAGVVSVRVAGLSGCLGGHPNDGAGTSGKAGGRGGEITRTAKARTFAPTEIGSVTPSDAARARLDDRLVGLIEADDRAAYAAERGLAYADGRVLVVAELESDADSPPSPPMEGATRRGSLVVGRAAVVDLVAVATADGVRYVRPPQAPVTADAAAGIERTGGT